MAEIEEVAIEPEDIPENAQDITQDTPEKHDISEDIPKKGRGRPAGAKNKPKPKPKTVPKSTPKPKTKNKPVEYEEYTESEEEEAPPPRRSRADSQMQPVDTAALASQVLGLLQQQRYQKTSARRSHYASWFENM